MKSKLESADTMSCAGAKAARQASKEQSDAYEVLTSDEALLASI